MKVIIHSLWSWELCVDGDRRMPMLKSWREKGKPTKESVAVSFC